MDNTDDALAAVELAINAADPDGTRFARTLRRTFDQIYDGRNTGRYSWQQLYKTEKTHFGSLIEINLRREFAKEFADGLKLDYQIAGHEVDCKWAQMDGQRDGQWMLPREVVGEICLVLTGSDDLAVWSAGLVRAVEALLTTAKGNQDRKKWLAPAGRAAIRWLWKKAMSLPENVLLRIDAADRKAIMVDLAGSLKGQKRLNELFRRVPNRIIGRGVVATVAQQEDYMKRVREGRGSRQYLRPEGVVVFGDYQAHRALALGLGLPAIGNGDSMSARLIKVGSSSDRTVRIADGWYRLCAKGEEPTKPAPKLPGSKPGKRT